MHSENGAGWNHWDQLEADTGRQEDCGSWSRGQSPSVPLMQTLKLHIPGVAPFSTERPAVHSVAGAGEGMLLKVLSLPFQYKLRGNLAGWKGL